MTPGRDFTKQALCKPLRVKRYSGIELDSRIFEETANIGAGTVRTVPALLVSRGERPCKADH